MVFGKENLLSIMPGSLFCVRPESIEQIDIDIVTTK